MRCDFAEFHRHSRSPSSAWPSLVPSTIFPTIETEVDAVRQVRALRLSSGLLRMGRASTSYSVARGTGFHVRWTWSSATGVGFATSVEPNVGTGYVLVKPAALVVAASWPPHALRNSTAVEGWPGAPAGSYAVTCQK